MISPKVKAFNFDTSQRMVTMMITIILTIKFVNIKWRSPNDSETVSF